MTKPQIILCADDYAQNLAISEGICELVAARRLSAVSCMTTTADWEAAAKMLQPDEAKVDIGLHFNLTHGALLTRLPFSHRTLMSQCFLGKLNPQSIIDELTAQLQRFNDIMKRPPDFIDGHQHIQQLPTVRRALIEVYQRQFDKTKPYLRIAGVSKISSLMRSPNKLKQLLIHFTGARQLQQLAAESQIPYISSFSGIYNFGKHSNYATIFKRFLAAVSGPSLIMCHPGNLSDDIDDSIRAARPRELAYFKSQQFLEDLTTMKYSLCRFQETL